MPPKRSDVPGLSARKNTGSGNDSRTARKMNALPPPGISDDENDENQSIIKSSSHSTGGLPPYSNAKTETSSSSRDDVNVEASLLAPLVAANNANRDQSSSAASATTSSRTSPFKGRGKRKAMPSGKTSLKGLKRKSESSRSDNEESDDDSPRARSHSHRGYNWNTEKLDIRPEDVSRRISYHNSIRSTIEREGKYEEVKFRRGDLIWILPDSSWLEDPAEGVEIGINELPADDWWVATILDCCALDQSERGDKTLGILRIKWMYEPDMLPKVQSLHKDWIKKVRAYRFDENEMIESDHVDFIGIETFGGFADGKFSYLRLTGLEVDDEERMKPEHKRKPPRKGLYTSMVGFSLKETAERKVEREALKGRQASARDMKTRKAARTKPYEMEVPQRQQQREEESVRLDGDYVSTTSS